MKRRVGLLVSAVIALIGAVHAEPPQRVSDLLSVPPVFHSFAGDPLIQFKPAKGSKREAKLSGFNGFHPKSGFGHGEEDGRLLLWIKGDESEPEVRREAALTLAKEFQRRVLGRENLNRHEKRLHLDSLFWNDGSQFVRLATKKLMGEKASEPWLDAWWKVRMGLPQTPDPMHSLILINLHYDHFEEKKSFGHFCFGLRKVGGDAEGDLLFDFRAPWDLDRQPRITEAVNIHNRLVLSANVENLYDWLYSQTEFRHCYVECWFLPISKEQVTLLRHIANRPVAHEAGQFRVFRKNCASLGMGLLHRLQPIGTPVPLGRGVADIPTVAAKNILEQLDDTPPYFRLTNVTHERGREPTAKSTIHKAVPSRATSRAFRLLRTVAEVN